MFKSTDGGKTWKKVLFRDNKTAAIDLAIDRRNPNVMYAALWEAYRVSWQMSSGGPGSGLFKSTDGGETWTEITRNPGLPAGVIGRIGVTVSGADGNRIYALVENENGGVFRSDDAGATWTRVNEDRKLRQRAFYYTHIYADPKAKDKVELGQLWPYLTQKLIFWCPIEQTNNAYFRARDMQVCSYTMNGSVSGFQTSPTGKPWVSYKMALFKPHYMIYWESDEKQPSNYDNVASYPNEGCSQRHSGGIVMGMFGGHTQFIKYKAYAYEAGIGGYPGQRPGWAWCNPGSKTGS